MESLYSQYLLFIAWNISSREERSYGLLFPSLFFFFKKKEYLLCRDTQSVLLNTCVNKRIVFVTVLNDV